MNIKIQDGTIIREKNSGKMFLMSHGRRRWILTIEAAEQFNLDLSQYEEYSDEELKQIPIGGAYCSISKKFGTMQDNDGSKGLFSKESNRTRDRVWTRN